jgi:hypothetical protein
MAKMRAALVPRPPADGGFVAALAAMNNPTATDCRMLDDMALGYRVSPGHRIELTIE